MNSCAWPKWLRVNLFSRLTKPHQLTWFGSYHGRLVPRKSPNGDKSRLHTLSTLVIWLQFTMVSAAWRFMMPDSPCSSRDHESLLSDSDRYSSLSLNHPTTMMTKQSKSTTYVVGPCQYYSSVQDRQGYYLERLTPSH